MRVFERYQDIPRSCRGGVVAVGNFDGVHPGHRAVISMAIRLARGYGAPAGVLTFEPHPKQVFQPDLPPFRLTTARGKLRLLEALGLDFALCQSFDRAFAEMEAHEFVEQVLVGGMGAGHLVVGPDFMFGRRQQGNIGTLTDMAGAAGFALTCINAVLADRSHDPTQPDDRTRVFSSTNIRSALREGRPEEAARLLGRPWEIEGVVQRGDARGRTIGCPTANLGLGALLRPRNGVYAIRAAIDEAGGEPRWIDGVANLGIRPTFRTDDVTLEAHLFDFSGDLYDRDLRVALIGYIRPERKFDGLPALMAQIAEDAATARRILAAHPALPARATRTEVLP